MRTIDLQTWSRREHFKFFNSFDHPHFGLCANVDLTQFHAYIKQNGISFSVAIVYLITRTANAIPEFRYRIRPGVVIEHELVHPSYTILIKDDLFSFCTLEYIENFPAFTAKAVDQIAFVKEHPALENTPGNDDLLYMTALPWVSFTSFMHPMNLQPADSIPRFAWGKYFEEGGMIKMPLGVQAHHALMDGIHVGRYYEQIQESLYHPELVLG
jgi:chloramphenicol O-acetyltransferase type A